VPQCPIAGDATVLENAYVPVLYQASQSVGCLFVYMGQLLIQLTLSCCPASFVIRYCNLMVNY